MVVPIWCHMVVAPIFIVIYVGELLALDASMLVAALHKHSTPRGASAFVECHLRNPHRCVSSRLERSEYVIRMGLHGPSFISVMGPGDKIS